MRSHVILSSLVLFCAVSLSVRAQPRSAGIEISPFRFGATYHHSSLSEDVSAVHIASVGVDMTGPLLQRIEMPGIYADYSCDFTIVEKARRDVVFSFLAGPGIDLGYATDIDSSLGFFLGAMADLRAEFTFRSTPLAFGIILKPTVALQLYREEGVAKMGLYKHGLINSAIPQFGLTYRLDHKEVTGRNRWEGRPQREYEYDFPFVTFGIEWGYIAQFHVYSHFNYTADGGYRVDFIDNSISYRTNAQILGHIGINATDHLNFAVYAGYQGITRKQKIFPVSLRSTFLFGQPSDQTRWLTYLGGGIGLKGSKNMRGNAIVGHAGFGYRVNLTRETKLDFLCAVQGTYWHPDYFSETIDVRRSNEILLGLNLGVGLSF